MSYHYEYIEKIRLALDENELGVCYNTIKDYLQYNPEISGKYQNEINKIDISTKEFIKDANRLVAVGYNRSDQNSFAKYRDVLADFVNRLAKDNGVKFDKFDKTEKDEDTHKPQHILRKQIPIKSKLLNIEESFKQFQIDWVGYVDDKSDQYVSLKYIDQTDSDVRIIVEMNLNRLELRGYGNEKELEPFWDKVNRWWDEKIQESGTLKVFLSYSHIDAKWKDALMTSLGILKRRKLIRIWHDRAIRAGDQWSKEVDEALEKSHIVLLLISPEFIDSEYCYDIETEKALELYNKKQCRVIPIFVREAFDSGAKYLHLQGFPEDKTPLRHFGKAKADNEGIQQVARAIGSIVEEILSTGKII